MQRGPLLPPGATETPVLTVFLTVRDEASTIDAQLEALANQDLAEPWQLLVVDTGSRDDTVARARAWQSHVPQMAVLELPGPERYCVPREAVDAAEADRFAFCDGDDVVSTTWVRAMSGALATHDLVTGPLDLRTLNPSWALSGEDVAAALAEPPSDGFLPFALGCNLGVRRSVYERVGGFDGDLHAGVDKDLCWRLQLEGVPLHFEPEAVVHRRLRCTARRAFRQYQRYGESNARLHERYRSAGQPRERLLRWSAIVVWLLATVPGLLARSHRMRWSRVAGLRWGRLLGSARRGVWFP